MGSHRRVAVAWQSAEGRFVSTGSHAGYTIQINAPAPPGDDARPPTGYSPIELLLASAGACAAWDVVQMLRKRRLSLLAVDVEVEGFQADQPPWEYERIALHFVVRCQRLTVGVLERVVRLAVVRYCGALATVRGVATVEASLELVGGDGESSGRQPVRLDVAVVEPLDEPRADEG
ncbi:MAG TPA: OsmC family protein [Candidatus Limnocylindrales bacterium]|nr:OsmC family protein [Candidatus Limnocylindrales bacterium]